MDPNTRIGRKAQVFYKGGISGEEPIDNHSHGNPVELVLGVGDVPPGLDRAFLEMSVGEERTVVIPPSLGYGEHDKAGVQIYPRTLSPAFEKIHTGDVVAWTNPASGKAIPVRVVNADAQLITLDFNHPFAGKELTYWLRLESIG